MVFFLNHLVGMFTVGWEELLPTLARVINLLLFVGLMYYLLRRPLGEAFRARQEGIRRELLRAEEERAAAVAKLEEVEGRLARLDAEVEAIRAQAQREAAEERARREIESAAKAARAELRAYVAEQSVGLAEELIRREIRPEDDAHLDREYVEEL